MAEVTQDVPKGVAGTGGSFIYDQRDVLRNAEMMNRNAQLEAMQRTQAEVADYNRQDAVQRAAGNISPTGKAAKPVLDAKEQTPRYLQEVARDQTAKKIDDLEGLTYLEKTTKYLSYLMIRMIRK